MTSLTNKLTRPKNYKTPAVLAKEKKEREKAEKERIRAELLAPEPATGTSLLDTRLYSDSLADKSENSKSDA